MTRKTKKVPKQFQRYLRSYDIDKMDLESDEKEIKKAVKTPHWGVWFEKVLNFWTIIFNIKLKGENFKKAIFG